MTEEMKVNVDLRGVDTTELSPLIERFYKGRGVYSIPPQAVVDLLLIAAAFNVAVGGSREQFLMLARKAIENLELVQSLNEDQK